MDTKKLILWSFYNFGGAVVEIVFILYFSQWLVIDRGLPDIWFNATLIISSVLVLLAAPLVSYWGDIGGGRMGALRFGTIAAFVCFVFVGLAATLLPSLPLLTVVFFIIGLFFYLFEWIFWCALLPDIADENRSGIASGWGQFGGWMGQITGLALAFPFVSGAIILFGAPGRAQTFLPASVLFLLCMLPMMLLYRENAAPRTHPFTLGREYRWAITNFLTLCRTRGLGQFFLAFFFFNDAVITAANNFPIYLQRVFGVDDAMKSFLLLGILSSSAVGALIGGYLADRIGYRDALILNLAGWLVILPSMAATNDFSIFAGETVAMGLLFGSVWVIARTLIVHLTPKSSLNSAFTYYTLMERFATFIGPLAWSIIVAYAPKTGAGNYRIALVSMTFFVFVGFLIARKVPTSARGASVVS